MPSSETTSRIDDLRYFTVQHPAVSPWVDILLGVFTTCQSHVSEPVDLKVAYRHVFGDAEQNLDHCPYCKTNYDRRVADQKQYIT